MRHAEDVADRAPRAAADRSWSVFSLVAILLFGAVIGGALTFLGTGHQAGDSIPPLVVPGTVDWVDVEGSRMTFAADPGHEVLQFGGKRVQGFDIQGVATLGLDGAWHDRAVCIPPLSRGQRLEVAIVRTRPIDGAPGKETIVWIKCLSGPTEQDVIE